MIRRRYGEGPLHLVAHLAALGATGLAAAMVLDARAPVNAVAWLVGAALAHDLVFTPVLAGLDRLARAGGRLAPRRLPSPVNHLRFVAVVGGALLLVYFPLILDRAPANYLRATGHRPEGYAADWLRIVAGLAILAAIAYASRLARGRQELDHPVGAPADEHAPGA